MQFVFLLVGVLPDWITTSGDQSSIKADISGVE